MFLCQTDVEAKKTEEDEMTNQDTYRHDGGNTDNSQNPNMMMVSND